MIHARARSKASAWVGSSLLLLACEAPLSRAELEDPAECQSCHPEHYREWSGSAHAYAATNPVFEAMQARGLRETGGALGEQCLECHDPRAWAQRTGLETYDTPVKARGVTCFVCHALKGDPRAVLDEEAPLALSAGLVDPVETGAHASSYSELHDRFALGPASVCESCHRVTQEEWEASVYATPDPRSRLTCGGCHMGGRPGLAADVDSAPLRRVHDHQFVGASLALEDWPEHEAQRKAIERELESAVLATLCVLPFGGGSIAQVTLDNVAMGHAWPTASSPSRRAWVELVAYEGDQVVFETGRVADDQAVDGRAGDPYLWLLSNRALNSAGAPTHFPWEAASYKGELLPPSVTNDPKDPRFIHSLTRFFPGGDRVTLRVRLRPVDFDVLDALITSGDLDPKTRARAVTWTLAGTVLEWRSELNRACVP